MDQIAVSAASRKAIRALGWDVVVGGDHLLAKEDPAHLCCTIAPVTTEIHISEVDRGRTRVQLDASVAGWGLIAGRQLTDRLMTLERKIFEQSARSHPGAALAKDQSVVPG